MAESAAIMSSGSSQLQTVKIDMLG